MSKRLDWPQYTRWTWMIALLALIALLWMWASSSGSNASNCCGKPVVEVAAGLSIPEIAKATTSVSVTTQTLVTTPALVQTVNASWADDKITLNGVVGTKGTKKAMLAAAIANYGEANVIDKLTVDRTVNIILTGEADSDTSKAKRGTEAHAFYSGATVENQLKVKLKTDAVTLTTASKVNVDAAPPTTVTKVAVDARPTSSSKVQCVDNIVIAANFAKGSGRLSPEMAEVLEAVVPCIKGKYEIGGYTDNIGEDDRNQVLSQRRAKTVANFLIEKGIDAKLLNPKGYGEAVPIGDNSTEEGRIKNRRIEFKKM